MNVSGPFAPIKGIMEQKPKAKLTAKEKREISVAIDRVVSALPLEFRGNDPNLRRHMETVMEAMLNRKGRVSILNASI